MRHVKTKHVINEDYGDYVYRKESREYVTPGLGAFFLVVGIFGLIGGLSQGNFGGALILAIISIVLGLGLLYFAHNKRKRMDRYAKRRKKHGAPIHDSYWN